jgi:hypothetical protein
MRLFFQDNLLASRGPINGSIELGGTELHLSSHFKFFSPNLR